MRKLSPRATRAWTRVHTWTSLACTLAMLILCLTGLPLIFGAEIDAALGASPAVQHSDGLSPRLDADRLVDIARGRAPGAAVQMILPDDASPIWRIAFGPSAEGRRSGTVVSLDTRTGDVLGVAATWGGAFTSFMLTLHANLFLGQSGNLLIGGFGASFLASLVSGVVVYAPFMRRLAFGTVRRGARLRWLDLHNLAGIGLALWLLVIGATGIVNALARQIFAYWQATELAEMIRPALASPPPARFVGVQRAIDAAQRAAPDMTPRWIAMPGNLSAGPRHYAVFVHDATPLGTRLYKPVLVDAGTGEVTAARDMPWYVSMLALAKPLHFGDSGGLPLKIVWALLDLVAILVLASGLVLWLRRRGAGARRAAAG